MLSEQYVSLSLKDMHSAEDLKGFVRETLEQSPNLLEEVKYIAPKKRMQDALMASNWVAKLPFTGIEYYHTTIKGTEGDHIRLYLPTVYPEGERPYIPTMLLGDRSIMEPIAQQQNLQLLSVGDTIAYDGIGTNAVSTESLAQCGYIARVLDSAIDPVYACRKSSLKLCQLAYLRMGDGYVQVRAHQNVVDPMDNTYVGFIGKMYEQEPLTDQVHSFMFTNSEDIMYRNSNLAWMTL